MANVAQLQLPTAAHLDDIDATGCNRRVNIVAKTGVRVAQSRSRSKSLAINKPPCVDDIGPLGGIATPMV